MEGFAAGEALGVSCFAGSLEEAADLVIARALAGAGGYAVLCSMHGLTTAQRDRSVRAALADAWAVFPDGVPVVWLLRRSGAQGAQRVYGPDLMLTVIERGLSHGLRHSLLGSTPAVLQELELRLRQRFPAIEIADTSAPFGDQAALDAVVPQLRKAQPHIIWCSFGAPKQDLWMRRNAAELAPAVAIGVGAAFDFHAGAKPQAPRWMQRVGLEWLFRLGTEPLRLGPRYAVIISRSVLLVARHYCGRRRNVDS